MFFDSASGNLLIIEKSMLVWADPRKTFRPTFPKSVPTAPATAVPSDAEGLAYWRNQIDSGWEQTLENNKIYYVVDFVDNRLTLSYLLTPREFVDHLFANAGSTPSESERAKAINEFGSATNTSDSSARVRALRDVVDSGSLEKQEVNHAFVLMQYFGYLRRNPTIRRNQD